MKIFASALRRELISLGIDVDLIAPTPVFGRVKRSAVGLGKWLGYIDRFLLFPLKLRAAAARADVVHLCDHGSSMYVVLWTILAALDRAGDAACGPGGLRIPVYI